MILKLILVFTILINCFINSFDCENEFENLFQEKCEEIDSCSYNPNDATNPCVEEHDCQSGKIENCRNINPPNYLTHKCEWTSNGCTPSERTCSDYKNSNGIIGNSCSLLKTQSAQQRCVLIYGMDYLGSETQNCEDHYKECSKIPSTSSTLCRDNIPANPLEYCDSNNDATSPPCSSYERYCDNTDKSFINLFGKEQCDRMPLTGTNNEKSKKRCKYNGEKCKEEFIQCSDQSVSFGSECENYTPLDQNNNYDFQQICTHDTSATGIKCIPRKRKCSEYNKIPGTLFKEDICEKLETSETYYSCIYDKENNKCKEEYSSCEEYITNKVETDENYCEKIVLKNDNEKCVYIQKTDECVTRKTYQNCEAYEGSDKKICESILSSDTSQYCILDKDSKCIEKPVNCTEALYNEEMCLKIAKAIDSNKRCAFGYTPTSNGRKVCYEEYIRCEDYPGTDKDECEDIMLYDGKKCKWEGSSGATNINRCISDFKTCRDAKTKEECKLINITGVIDPERKVCDWIAPNCIENYKYCSDYRGTNDITCANIKPYDESGEKLDIGFKCKLIHNSIGCEKVPVECEDAGESRSLCESYSQYIKDYNKKFCVFDDYPDPDGKYCHSHYRKCEYIKDKDFSNNICTNNIIEGYIRGACVVKTGKCVTENICSKFTQTFKSKQDFFIRRANANCSYDSVESVFKYTEKSCENVVFYSNDTNNREICENMTTTKSYKKCILKEDHSGCIEVYREFNYSTAGISYSTPPDASTQENSSGIIEKGIYFIMFLICFLI